MKLQHILAILYKSNQRTHTEFISLIKGTMKSCDLLAGQRVQVADSVGATYPVAQGVGEEVPFPLQAFPARHDEQLLAPIKINKTCVDEK